MRSTEIEEHGYRITLEAEGAIAVRVDIRPPVGKIEFLHSFRMSQKDVTGAGVAGTRTYGYGSQAELVQAALAKAREWVKDRLDLEAALKSVSTAHHG